MKHQAPANQHLAPTAHASGGAFRPPADHNSMNRTNGGQWSRNQWSRNNQWPRNQGSGNEFYEPYMSEEKAAQGLERGQLIQGPLRINPKRFAEAFVPSPDGTRDIFLDGMPARNRALNGDVVAVRLLPRSQWRVVRSKADGEGAGRVDETPSGGEGEPSSSPPRPHRETLQRTARVVHIMERKHSRAATGSLAFISPDSPVVLFRPVDHRVPRVHVPLADCPAGFASRPGDYAHTLFVCRIGDWPADSVLARGRLESALGRAGEIRPETDGILAEYDVDSAEFPEDVLACLPRQQPWSIPAEELSKRKDLRSEVVFTIDPASANDLDDALSCKPLPDGNLEVGVHIADVSYFVEEGGALDAAAGRRATSVYLVQKTIPMLPALLCEELCSLRPDADRLAFSVVWTLTPQGEVLSEWFGRSVIRSCAKLSYEHAQSMIDRPGGDGPVISAEEEEVRPAVPEQHPSVDEVRRAVLHLHAIAKELRARRFRDGALRLDRSKLCFTLDEEGGSATPRSCHVYRYGASNELVEEFMLMANMAVARHVYQSFPELALLRRHPPPQDKMVLELQDFCHQMGLQMDFSSAGALHGSLAAAVGRDRYSAARKEVLTNTCSRVMQTAEYFCCGVVRDESRFRHYALNVPLYTHFTSPIRRYADLLVHRLLAASLGCGPPVRLGAGAIHKQARHCNDKRAASKRAQELSTDLYFNVFVREHRGAPLESEAMVMGVMEYAFDVLLLRYGVQKRIYPKDVSGLRAFQHSRVGRRSELTLVWSAVATGEGGGGGRGCRRNASSSSSSEVCQVISLFAVVEVQLRSEGPCVRCVLKRPVEDASSQNNNKNNKDNKVLSSVANTMNSKQSNEDATATC